MSAPDNRATYNAPVPGRQRPRRTFTLADAQRMLPDVRARTERAVDRAHALAEELEQLSDTDPRRTATLETLDGVVTSWARDLRTMGLEVKGLWLVDFDTGEGYYCWKYPEPAVQHYHGYGDGFAGRMKVV